MLAERLNPSLEALRLRLARTGLPGWWASALAALSELLPARWRQALFGRREALGLQLEQGQLRLFRLAEGAAEPLGELPLDDDETLQALRRQLAPERPPARLLLAEGEVLRRRLSLPLAAEARLGDVLRHEIDRQTPFTPDQVCFAGRVLQRDAAARQLQVELVVLPRARLQAQLQALGPLGEGLAGLDVLVGGRPLGVDLLPPALRGRRSDPARRLQWELLGSALLLLLAALLLTLNNRAAALAALREQVAAARDEVRQVRILRNQLQASADAANFLAQAKASRPAMLELLDDLTRRIPDDTALDKLAVSEGRLVLVGLSRSPAALPRLLQDSPLLLRPALAGAVQTDVRSGRERFTLTATVQRRSPEAGDGAP